MSSFCNFLRRHRGKLVYGSAAAGGVLLAASLINRHLDKSRAAEGRRILEQTRKRNHFESTESTCNSTIAHLYLEMRDRILTTFDSSPLTEILRSIPSPQPAEKIRIWNEIKVLCFCKISAFIICEAFLGVLVRIQMNVLAGCLFTQNSRHNPLDNNNRDVDEDPRLTRKLQEKYLSTSQHFLQQGFLDFTEVLLVNVKRSVDSVKLQERLKIEDVENIFSNILQSLFQESIERNLFLNPGKFLLFSLAESREVDGDMDLDSLTNLLSETMEILESQEVVDLLKRLCRQGFAFLTDRLAQVYLDQAAGEVAADPVQSLTKILEIEENQIAPYSSGTTASEFRSPCSVRIPLAKLVPVLSAEVAPLQPGETEEWLLHLIENTDLKLLGANIYETFCSDEKEQTGSEPWYRYIQTSVSSYF